MAKIVVLGAGVSGLTTAVSLAQRGHQVAIVARHLPGDQTVEYTSPWAGAFWYHLADRSDPEWTLDLQDISSYYEFLEIARAEPAAGVWEREVVVFLPSSALPAGYTGPWFKDLVRDYTEISASEFPEPFDGENIVFGFRYTGFVITPMIYLNFLLAKCANLGVTVIRRTVGSLKEAQGIFLEESQAKRESRSRGASLGTGNFHVSQSFSKADVVVNCTGYHAGKLSADPQTVPIKGQTILVENCCEKLYIVEASAKHPHESLYIIPRRDGGTLLTGTHLENDTSATVDSDLKQRIMERALKYVPQLVDPSFMQNRPELVVVRDNVGIRPGRNGGARVASETIDGIRIVHNYGAGANGYQASFGLAKRAVQQVESLLSTSRL